MERDLVPSKNIRGTIYRLYNSFSTLHNEKDNASIHLKYILIVEFIVLQEKPGRIARTDTQQNVILTYDLLYFDFDLDNKKWHCNFHDIDLNVMQCVFCYDCITPHFSSIVTVSFIVRANQSTLAKITDLQQITDKFDHIKLYHKHVAM